MVRSYLSLQVQYPTPDYMATEMTYQEFSVKNITRSFIIEEAIEKRRKKSINNETLKRIKKILEKTCSGDRKTSLNIEKRS